MPATTARSDRRAIDRIAAGLALALVLAIVVAAGWQTLAEYRVVAARAASVAQAAGDEPAPAFVRSDVPPDDLAPRIALLRGMMRARAAAAGGPPALIERAAADVDRARRARPVWAETDVAAAYVELLRGGQLSPAAIAALRRSYVAAPFLRDAAPWRIRYAVTVWPRLDASTRARVVAETAWLALASGRTYNYARGLVAGSPAASAVDAVLASNGS